MMTISSPVCHNGGGVLVLVHQTNHCCIFMRALSILYMLQKDKALRKGSRVGSVYVSHVMLQCIGASVTILTLPAVFRS